MNTSQFADPLEPVRIALLKYYNSQCMTHGAYVISLIVGVSVLLSRWDLFYPNLWTFSVFSEIVIGFVLVFTYAIGRSFYWGSLASNVMIIKNELINNEQLRNRTRMFRLHYETCEEAKRTNFFAKHFWSGRQMLRKLVSIYVIVFGVHLIIVGVYLLL